MSVHNKPPDPNRRGQVAPDSPVARWNDPSRLDGNLSTPDPTWPADRIGTTSNPVPLEPTPPRPFHPIPEAER
jgi:hypothetical protein